MLDNLTINNLKRNGYVYILLLLVIPSIVASNELECDSSNISNFAFSRISPIQVSTSEDMKSEEFITVKYGIAYPIVLQQRRQLKICIEGKKYWVKKSHIAVSNSPEWVSTSSVALASRPKLTLWRSRERLGTYLARTNATDAPSDYTESSVDKKYVRSLKLAVDKSDVMEMKIKGKQVDVASLLIPFPLSALNKYKLIQLEKKKTKEIKMVILIDASGSTEGFVTSFLVRLSKSWDKAGLSSLKNIMLLSFDSDGYVSEPKFISSSTFANLSLEKHKAKSIGKESKALSEAIMSASKKISLQKYKPPLIVLAGGDVSLSLSRYLNKFGDIKLVKITPEIQHNLKKSLDVVSKAEFIEFQSNNANTLLKEIITITDSYNKNKNSLAYEDIAPEFGKRAMLPLLPTDLDLTDLAIPPAYVTKKSDWFAVNLWTVINGELLKFSENSLAK